MDAFPGPADKQKIVGKISVYTTKPCWKLILTFIYVNYNE